MFLEDASALDAMFDKDVSISQSGATAESDKSLQEKLPYEELMNRGGKNISTNQKFPSFPSYGGTDRGRGTLVYFVFCLVFYLTKLTFL